MTSHLARLLQPGQMRRFVEAHRGRWPTGSAARELGLSRWTILRMLQDGTLPGIRRRSRWYADLDGAADVARANLRPRGER